MKTIRVTLNIIDTLIKSMRKLKQYSDIKKIDVNMCIDYEVDNIIEAIEDIISRAKYCDIVGDIYIADMLYYIVMTYDDTSNGFADVKSSSDNSLWYKCIFNDYGWSDSSNVVEHLVGLKQILRGKPYRWNLGNQMSIRNIYLTNTSMYILSRYYPENKEILNRLETLESM